MLTCNEKRVQLQLMKNKVFSSAWKVLIEHKKISVLQQRELDHDVPVSSSKEEKKKNYGMYLNSALVLEV